MSQINVKNLSNENDDGAPDIVGVSTFSATSYMVPPVGTTAQRPDNPQGGDLRFNTDSASLEYFRGDTFNWEQIEMTSPDLDGGARALQMGGTISSLGDSVDFGDISTKQSQCSTACSPTRAVTSGGNDDSGTVNTISYVEIQTKGDTSDFGDLVALCETNNSVSNAHGGL